MTSAAHAGDPSRNWKSVETEHFIVNYYEPLDDVARRVAVVAERAHSILAPSFGWEPSEKTNITIVDDTDGSNGFATVLPRNSIRLFATAPRGVTSLADHDDWLYGLTAHEYTHIVHLDSIGGLPKWYNKIFGKTWAPNQVQPRWVIEGIATYEESKRSSGGRTRHAVFDADLRVATLAGDERRLDEITHGPRAWPHGNSAYLYGSHFLKYIFDRFGDDKLREMSWDYGSNPIPYGLNQSVRRATGHTFVELYDDWREFRRSKYALQKEAIERQGQREGRRLTFSGEANTGGTYTRDGKSIVWFRSDGQTINRFAVMPTDGNVGDEKTYVVVDRAGVYDLLDDGRMIVEQTRNFRTDYNFQDLHLVDPKTGSSIQLTKGLRALDPAVSRDGSKIAFVKNGGTKRVLMVMPIQEDAEPTVVWEGQGRFDQALVPTWSPDGEKIAFSAWRQGGYKDILVLDLTTGQIEEIQRDRAQDIDPEFTPDGRYLLFSSDRTGIFNVFAHDLETGELYQVTNVVGTALEPDVSPDGKKLLYTGFSASHDSGGAELYEIPLDPSTWTRAEVYVNDRPDPIKIRDDEVEVSKPMDYRPLASLAPRTYTVQLQAAGDGSRASIQTDGADIIGRHVYTLGTTIGLSTGELSIGGSYTYNRLWPQLRVAINRNKAVRGGFIIDGESTRYSEETVGATATVSLPVLRDPDASGNLSLSYDWDLLRNVGDELGEPDPNDLVPRMPETDVNLAGLALRWNYRNSKGFLHGLGPQQGQAIALSLRMDHPAIGSDFHSLNLDYRWDYWHKLPFGVTPVMAVRLAGGLRTTDRGRVGAFTLGGAPQQDIVDAILNSLRTGSTGFLRGYPAREVTGRQFHLLNLEYRQELLNFERGFATLPIYLRRLHVAGLFDAGDAFNGEIDFSTFKTAVGASLRMDFVLAYTLPGSLDVGYAHGLSDTGIGEYWVLLTGNI